MRKLVGELALFRFTQDESPHYALGQITEVKLVNIWHEDATIRSLIRQRGRVDAVSGRQDTHLGQMALSAVFRQGGSRGFEPSMLGTVPPTGTPIHLVDDAVLHELLKPYHDQIFYLGQVYGSKPLLPMWFKHFDRGPDGAGEAYHIGIFGKTGSGKSVLAKLILLGYARHRDMAILIIDPQGEFSQDFRQGAVPGAFALPMAQVCRQLGRKVVLLTVRDLVLDRWELFEQILFESDFFTYLTMPKGENRATACQMLSEAMQKANVKLADLHTQASFDKAWSLLEQEKFQTKFYRTPAARERFNEALQDADREHFYQACWGPVCELFRTDRIRARTPDKALAWLLGDGRQGESGPLLVVDLSRSQASEQNLLWNERIQALVIKRLLDGLSYLAEARYRDGQSLNTLVVIDEAHRLAPRERLEDEAAAAVRSALVDAARTTRKYGLGWMFISQTLSSIHTEIIQQLRIFFFGFGLGLGQEFQSLRQLVGSSESALNLYQSFRDPHSAFDIGSRQYSFMTIGPVSPLSFAGTPLFFNAFNAVGRFLEANGLVGSTSPVGVGRSSDHSEEGYRISSRGASVCQ
jgi:hypothetical protein